MTYQPQRAPQRTKYCSDKLGILTATIRGFGFKLSGIGIVIYIRRNGRGVNDRITWSELSQAKSPERLIEERILQIEQKIMLEESRSPHCEQRIEK